MNYLLDKMRGEISNCEGCFPCIHGCVGILAGTWSRLGREIRKMKMHSGLNVHSQIIERGGGGGGEEIYSGIKSHEGRRGHAISRMPRKQRQTTLKLVAMRTHSAFLLSSLNPTPILDYSLLMVYLLILFCIRGTHEDSHRLSPHRHHV